MWERYCRGVQAIVYVVDSADKESIETARGELHELLSKHSLDGIPLLVLGNKNDLPGALSTVELIDKLELKVCCGQMVVCWCVFSLTPVYVHGTQKLHNREVCCYSISCKKQNNIDITIEWLTKHAKS